MLPGPETPNEPSTQWGIDRIDNEVVLRHSSRTLFICWTPYHGRTEDLAEVLGVQPVYIWPSVGSRGVLGTAWRYAKSIAMTRQVLAGQKHSMVFLMLPPPFMLLGISRSLRQQAKLVLDIHSGLFTDRRWKAYLKPLWRHLTPTDVIIAHNENDASYFETRVPCRIVHMQDPIFLAELRRSSAHYPRRAVGFDGYADGQGSETVLFPSSGDTDEPLEEFIEAIKVLAHRKFSAILTGVAARARFKDLESAGCLTMPGFLPRPVYVQELRRSTVVVSLSTRPNIVQRAAFEAMATGARSVVSSSISMRALLGESAVYVDPTSSISIAAGITEALQRGRLSDIEYESIRHRMLDREREQLRLFVSD